MSSKKAEEYSGLLEAPLVRQADSELKNWGTEISHIFEDETKLKIPFKIKPGFENNSINN